jgi:hypothetical protein
MTPPKDVRDIFPDFSVLVEKASAMKVAIDPLLLSQVLSVSVQLDPLDQPLGTQDREHAITEWSKMLAQNQGQALAADDFWEWFKKWFVPDPMQADKMWLRILAQAKAIGRRPI